MASITEVRTSTSIDLKFIDAGSDKQKDTSAIKINGEHINGHTSNSKDGIHSTKTPTPLEMISRGGPVLSSVPTFPDFSSQRQWQLSHLAAAFRHWAREGYTFGFSGHISYRDPEYTHAFWTNPIGTHFGLLRASDMILLNLQGEVIGGNRKKPANGAGFQIHAAVHKARPDVHAACHAHSPSGKAWSAFNRRLDMITQDACKFYGDAHAVYSSHGGVVLAEEEGDRIAHALGPNGKGCILRNHGLLTVGKTVDEAAWLFDAMEHSCRDQLVVEAACAGASAGSNSGVKGTETGGRSNSLQKVIIDDTDAKWTFDIEGDPDYCYAEFQVYYEYEERMANGDFHL